MHKNCRDQGEIAVISRKRYISLIDRTQKKNTVHDPIGQGCSFPTARLSLKRKRKVGLIRLIKKLIKGEQLNRLSVMWSEADHK